HPGHPGDCRVHVRAAAGTHVSRAAACGRLVGQVTVAGRRARRAMNRLDTGAVAMPVIRAEAHRLRMALKRPYDNALGRLDAFDVIVVALDAVVERDHDHVEGVEAAECIVVRPLQGHAQAVRLCADHGHRDGPGVEPVHGAPCSPAGDGDLPDEAAARRCSRYMRASGSTNVNTAIARMPRVSGRSTKIMAPLLEEIRVRRKFSSISVPSTM